MRTSASWSAWSATSSVSNRLAVEKSYTFSRLIPCSTSHWHNTSACWPASLSDPPSMICSNSGNSRTRSVWRSKAGTRVRIMVSRPPLFNSSPIRLSKRSCASTRVIRFLGNLKETGNNSGWAASPWPQVSSSQWRSSRRSARTSDNSASWPSRSISR